MNTSRIRRPVEDTSPLPVRQGDRDLLLGLQKRMLVARKFEEAAAKAYGQGKIGGFCHLYIGQEAVGIGSISALDDGDTIVTTYRDHAQYIARTGDVRGAMAELFGRKGGCSLGLGGSMHMFDAKKGFLGGWGIVGGHVPLAAGAAFAAKYRGKDRVALVFFGEGATAQGAFHEGMSLAALWKLPVVFVCENNHYAMGTPVEREVPVDDLTKLASAYDMKRDRLEPSNDVLVVRDRVGAAVARARAGDGPTFIEMVTYRYRGHSMSDPAKYRTKEEVEAWKAADPLTRASQRLLGMGATQAELDALEAAAEKEVEDAVAWADAQPESDWETVKRCTYATPLPGLGPQ